MKIVDIKTICLSCELKGYFENRCFLPEPLGGGFLYFSHRPLMIAQVITNEGIIGIGPHSHSPN